MTIRAVLFDAVGTLFHSRGSVGEIYRGVALGYGVSADAAMLQREFVRLTGAEGAPVDKDGWKALVRAVFRDAGPFPRFDAFFEEVYDVFQSRRAWHCYPETRPVLEALRSRGLRLGVVSNFDSRLPGVLRDLDIDAYFQAVVTPDSAGHAKPDAGIFLEAAALVGVEPGEALFVGDDYLQDFAGARRAGLGSVLLDRERPNPAPGEEAIGSLEDLLTILEVAGPD